MDMIRKTLLSLVAAIIFFLPLSAGASIMSESLDSLRCANHLVQLGETQVQVLHQCGFPDIKDSYPAENGSFDKWTYNMGPKDFIYVFTFFNGELRHIEQTDRGF